MHIRSFKIFIYTALALCVSCIKTIHDPYKEIIIKTGLPDAKTLASAGIAEIITLKDNSFWIRYRLKLFHERVEHYSDKLVLLDSCTFFNYAFSDFNVVADNKIVAAAFHNNPFLGYGKLEFIEFDNKIRMSAIDSGDAVEDKLAPFDKYIGFPAKLKYNSTGKYIFSLFTYPVENLDSSHIIMASYVDPVHSFTPDWVTHKKYYDYPRKIYSTQMIDMETDNQGNFYILLAAVNSTGSLLSCILRKHSADGTLLWQTPFLEQSSLYFFPEKIIMDDNRILIGTPTGTLYIFDLNGNFTTKPIPDRTFKLAFKNTSNGYIALSDSSNTGGKFARIMKLDHDFNLVSDKIFGNQGTPHSMLGKLSDGNYILAALVESPNLIDYNLMLLRFNDKLELVH
jgi:hypothetical protein